MAALISPDELFIIEDKSSLEIWHFSSDAIFSKVFFMQVVATGLKLKWKRTMQIDQTIMVPNKQCNTGITNTT